MVNVPSGPTRRVPVRFVAPGKVISTASPGESVRTGGNVCSSLIACVDGVSQPEKRKSVALRKKMLQKDFRTDIGTTMPH